ncbi:hypothetical protein E2C01_006714 [Portunus trituberculatus]|uniref:Uncharacterized protein n=1 Tax=Portunus trituberculatus TaxID=210409 RepID=A0A5B7CW35_PORTR|nr:hypothetical protein [Portunus trituberculatus]
MQKIILYIALHLNCEKRYELMSKLLRANEPWLAQSLGTGGEVVVEGVVVGVEAAVVCGGGGGGELGEAPTHTWSSVAVVVVVMVSHVVVGVGGVSLFSLALTTEPSSEMTGAGGFHKSDSSAR